MNENMKKCLRCASSRQVTLKPSAQGYLCGDCRRLLAAHIRLGGTVTSFLMGKVRR